MRRALVVVLAGAAAFACAERRDERAPPVAWDPDVRPVAAVECVRCHAEATTYLGALGCGSIGRALPDPSHPAIADGTRALFDTWLGEGAPAFHGTVHDASIIDPRSAGFHGRVLHDGRYRAMLDPNDASACGRCHDGAPSRPADVRFGAPGATACTACHATAADGSFACETCHAPRDPCLFPGDTRGGAAHPGHAKNGVACAKCHSPAQHMDGVVEVVRRCPECHDRGGARPSPQWTDPGPMTCRDCHGDPPPGHHPGACTSCHREPGTGPLHVNGKVDLGDGSGRCGACHGSGDSPWPTNELHAAHQNPSIASPVACATCHSPTQHMNGIVEVAPTCPTCHGPNPPSKACGSCHGIPPENHTASTSCDRATCHGGEVARDASGALSITPEGRALHVNGRVDVAR